MGRRQHHPTPAVGITNKWKRNGKQVADPEGNTLIHAKSLRKAKRYFRTGRES